MPLTLDEGSLIAFDMAPVEMGKLGQGKARDAFLKVGIKELSEQIIVGKRSLKKEN